LSLPHCSSFISHFRLPHPVLFIFAFLSYSPFPLFPFFRFLLYTSFISTLSVLSCCLVFFLSSFSVFFSMLSFIFLPYHVSLVRLASLYFFLLYILGYFNYSYWLDFSHGGTRRPMQSLLSIISTACIGTACECVGQRVRHDL
jgi:hypothetical protein